MNIKIIYLDKKLYNSVLISYCCILDGGFIIIMETIGYKTFASQFVNNSQLDNNWNRLVNAIKNGIFIFI